MPQKAAILFGLTLLVQSSFITTVAKAENSTPALQAFATAFEKINDFTYDLRTHEVLASDTQDRVYHYMFLKPTSAKTVITSASGAGSGFGIIGSVGVWTGGDDVVGHQGGILSMIHLKVGLHSHLTISLRGYTIPDGLMQNVVDAYRTVAGDISQHPGGKLAGADTDLVELKITNPSANAGVSRMDIYFSQATHLPIRNTWYQGDQIVRDQWFDNLKTNTGLKASDFGT
jgi:outer membrane lipoprotein-sorting protein